MMKGGGIYGMKCDFLFLKEMEKNIHIREKEAGGGYKP